MEPLIFVALIGIAAGIVKGVSGFGSSLVTIPLLTLVYGTEFVRESVVIMVTFNLVLNSLLLVENKGFTPESIKRTWLIPLFGSIFTIVGVYILLNTPEAIIRYIAGAMIVVAVVNKAFKLHLAMKDTPLTRAVVGSLSGIGNGIASIDGPPVVFYLTSINAPKQVFKNTLAAHFLVMGVIAVIFHVIEGSYSIDLMFLIVFMLVFTVVGLLIGMRLGRRLDEVMFERVVLVILVGLALSLFLG